MILTRIGYSKPARTNGRKETGPSKPREIYELNMAYKTYEFKSTCYGLETIFRICHTQSADGHNKTPVGLIID